MAAAQGNLLRRTQALEHLSEPRLARLIGPGGRWQVVLRGIYATFTGPLTRQQRLRSAQMYVGDEALVTGAAALKEYGFDRVPNESLIDMLIPANQARHSHSFLRIQRTHWLPDPERITNNVRYAPKPRAVMDACRRSRDLDECRAVLAEAVQRRGVTLAELDRELNAGPKAWSARPRKAFEAILAGAQAVSECDLVTTVAPSKVLPPMHFNCTVLSLAGEFLGRPDGYLDDVGLAVEVQSVEYHLYAADQEADMTRRLLFGRHGIQMLEFRPSRLRRDPKRVLGDLEASYLVRKAQGVAAQVKLVCRPDCQARTAS